MILNNIFGTKDNDINNLVKSYKKLNIEQTVTKMQLDGISEAEIKATLAAQNYTEADIAQAIATKKSNVTKTGNIALTKLQTASHYALAAASKVAKVAMSAFTGIIVSLVATSVIGWFDNIINRKEKLAEKAETAKNKIQELSQAFKSSSDFIEENKSKYAELAQSVDQLSGKNNTLSTEKYQEFLSLSNQLAEVFPELVSHYDENGNAILNLQGDVDSIVGSLQSLVKVQRDLANQQIADNLPSVFENTNDDNKELEDKIKKYTKYKEQYQTLMGESFFTDNVDTITTSDGMSQVVFKFGSEYREMIDDIQKELYDVISKVDDGAIISSEAIPIDDTYDYTYEFTANVNAIDLGEFDKSVDDIETHLVNKMASSEKSINDYTKQMEHNYAFINNQMISYLSTDWDYAILDTNVQEVIQKMVNNIQWRDVGVTSFEGAKQYISDNILQLFDQDTLPQKLKDKLLGILNQGTLSDSDYILLVQDVQGEITEYFANNGIDIPVDFNFLIANQQETGRLLQNRIGELVKNESDSIMLNDLFGEHSIDTTSEIEFFLSVTQDAKNATEAVIMFKNALQSKVDVIDIETINEQLDSIQSAYKTVSEAIDEYNTTRTLSLDTVQSLLSLDDKYIAALYDENGQLTLNAETYSALTKAKLYDLYVNVIDNAIQTAKELNTEEVAVAFLEQSVIDLTDAKMDLVTASMLEAQMELDLAKSRKEDTTERQKALDSIVATTNNKIKLIKEAFENADIDIGSLLNSNDDKSKNTPTEIDWLGQSLENLQRAVDDAQTTLDDTHGIQKQIDAINDLNDALEGLKGGYQKAADEYGDRYKNALSKVPNSDKMRKLIESGTKFDISTYSGGNAKYGEYIQEAIDNYNKQQEMLTKVSETDKQISDNKNIEKSKLWQEHFEKQLDITNAKLEDSTLSAEQRNSLLKEQYEWQKLINGELKKQALYEGDTETIKKIEEEEKQQKKENDTEQRKNLQDENKVKLDTYTNMLDNDSLTPDKKKTINDLVKGFQDEDLKYEFENIVNDTIGLSDFNTYIKSLKKKHKKTKMSDKKFIKKYLEEISKNFTNEGLYDWYESYLSSEDDYVRSDYDIKQEETDLAVSKNDNDIKDIQNDIDLAGYGTIDQYEKIIALQDDSLIKWEAQRKEALLMRDAATKNSPEYKYWDDMLQSCEDNINSINQGIKQSRIEILSLPLADIEKKINDINKEINTNTEQLDEQTELIQAAIDIFDTEIEKQNEIKEGIQNRIDALQKEHDLREENLNIQKAEWELEKSKENKTVKVFKEGQGFVFESDQEEVQNAQLNYDNLLYERKIRLLNDEVQRIDDTIESLNKQKKQWEDISVLTERTARHNNAIAYDTDFTNKVLSGNVTLLDTIKTKYGELYSTINTLEETKKPYELLQEEINSAVQEYSLGGSYKEALAKVKNAITLYYPEMLAKYEEQGTSLDEVAKKQLENAGVTEKTSEEILEDIQTSNEEILESYQTLVTDLGEVFEQLNTMMTTFSTNAQTMAASVTASISSIKNIMNGLSSIDSKKVDSAAVGVASSIAKNAKSAGKSHSGMKLGYIGDNSTSKDAFRYIALNELDDSEVVRILQKGEAVLNPNQINTVMSNFRKLAETKLPTIPLSNTQSNKSVNFSGDIIIQNAQNTHDLAKAIKTELPVAILQELYK